MRLSSLNWWGKGRDFCWELINGFRHIQKKLYYAIGRNAIHWSTRSSPSAPNHKDPGSRVFKNNGEYIEWKILLKDRLNDLQNECFVSPKLVNLWLIVFIILSWLVSLQMQILFRWVSNPFFKFTKAICLNLLNYIKTKLYRRLKKIHNESILYTSGPPVAIISECFKTPLWGRVSSLYPLEWKQGGSVPNQPKHGLNF